MKTLTWKEFYKLALRNYENGGDGIVECWDENTFNEYVAEFGPITEKTAHEMFDTAMDIYRDMTFTKTCGAMLIGKEW